LYEDWAVQLSVGDVDVFGGDVDVFEEIVMHVEAVGFEVR
jgi:hypothetical protein